MSSHNDSNRDTSGSNTPPPDSSYQKQDYNIPPVRSMPNDRRNSGCLLAVIFTLGIFAIIVFGGVYLFSSGTEFLTTVIEKGSVSITDNRRERLYSEEVLTGEDSNSRIAVIPVTGPIFGTGNKYYGAGNLHNIAYQLNMAANDSTVKAVILHIDSPGGGLSASDILYNEIKRLKDKQKKVIVYVGQICASGGYYIAAPADYIVAGPTSLVGSFGVIMQHIEVLGLLEKIGVTVEPLKSTDSKDIGSPFKKMTPEEKEYFDYILTTYHNRFIDIISTGRAIERSKIEKLANGKIYIATDALKYGLIDKIGYFDDSLTEAKKACISDYPQVIIYKRQMSLFNLFNAKSSAIPNVTDFLNENSATELNLMYNGVKSNSN